MDTVLNDGVVLYWLAEPHPSMRIQGGRQSRCVAFDPYVWARTNRGLEQGSGAAYHELAKSGEFGRWWGDACGGDQPGIRRFRIQMPPSEWERPWEAIVSALDTPRWDDISVIRQIEGDSTPPHPSEIDEALTILCIQGSPEGSGLHPLDLEAELQAILAAYNALDFSARQAISPPIWLKPSFAELNSALLKYRPTILWFSGHARANPPGLLLNDGHWLTPEELAHAVREVVAQGGRTPLYVVLWACETGALPFGLLTPAPPFIDYLGAQGVATVLAAQAPLKDTVARRVAAQVFAALASGRPLDHGVARARGELMRLAGENLLEEFDWICPVVWTKGSPPPFLRWRDGREYKAQRQATAHKLLPPSLRDLLVGPDEPEKNCMPWPDVPRLWVMSTTPGAVASRRLWAERVLTRQNQTERTVLWFDFSSPSLHPIPAHLVLHQWAEFVAGKTEHDDDRNQVIRAAAQEIKNDFDKGWRSLCSSELFMLAMIEPPAHNSDWLWNGLRQGNRVQAMVIANDYPDERAQEGWMVDTLIEKPNILTPTKTLAALAVLGHPAARLDIEEKTGEDLSTWINQSILVETNAGCFMPVTFSETLAKTLCPEQRTEAHRLAYSFLDGRVAHRKMCEYSGEAIFRARWAHAHASNWVEAIIAEGINLLKLYRGQGRSAAFLGIFEPMVSEQRSLPDDVKISAAWAYLDAGKPDKAQSWLELFNHLEDLAPSDLADWYTVRAETAKSSGQPGSKVDARYYLEKALSALDEGRGDDHASRQRLRIQHDIARLVHFFERRPAEAVEQYELLARNWETVPFSDLDRAITIRNLAEALMDCGRLECAENKITQARCLIPDWTQHIVVSELEYLSGRLAIRMGRDEADISSRFCECLDKALFTNHLMMAAIVDARMFWRAPRQQSAGSFDDTKWEDLAVALAKFERHAWAARVLINGRLRAARYLGNRGERRKAQKELADAKRLIEANPAFDEGDDRRRIAVLYAGLALYDPSASNWWDRLKDQYDWGLNWLAEQNSDDPNTIWEMTG